MSLRSSYAEGDSPAHKRDRVDADYSNFRPGYRADPVLASIPECAKEILMAGTKFYLPLQYLSDEVLEAEEASSIIMRPGDNESARRIVVTVDEATMTPQQYSSWSRRHIRAMEALRIRPEWIAMFASHYENIITASDWESAWPRYRIYDIKQRRRTKGVLPEDISRFDREMFDGITSVAANKTLSDLDEALARVKATASRTRNPPSQSGARTSQSHGNQSASSSTRGATKNGSLVKFVFDRCWVCGDKTHLFKFETPVAQRCSPRHLVHDAVDDEYKVPGSGNLICWAYNCKTGCRRKQCKHAHCCSLCGGAHACGACSR